MSEIVCPFCKETMSSEYARPHFVECALRKMMAVPLSNERMGGDRILPITANMVNERFEKICRARWKERGFEGSGKSKLTWTWVCECGERFEDYEKGMSHRRACKKAAVKTETKKIEEKVIET